MKKFFKKPAQNMTIGDSLVFSMLIGAASMALVVPILVVSALIEGQIDLPELNVRERAKKAKEKIERRIKRNYINLANENEEGEED